MSRRDQQPIRVTIDSLAYGGDGVGRDEQGRAVFVPMTAPGDVASVRVVEAKKAWARGELVTLSKASALRVEPPCPLFARADCGGCQWQHVADGAQRAAKEDVVRRALRKVTAAARPIETPAPAYRWRRRARLRWRKVRDGEPAILGYAARRSHRLIDVDLCPQMDERLEAALVAVRAALGPELDGAGELALLLSENGQVHVVVRGSGPGIAGLEPVSRTLIGKSGIAGVVLSDAPGEETVLGADTIDLADDPAAPFLGRADVFVQASAPGNAALRRLVLEAAAVEPGVRVLEVYAGSGNFTRDLAAAGAEVVAVEDVPPAVALAERNLDARGVAGRVRLERRRAEDALASPPPAERPDLIVLDPPRVGLPTGGARQIAAHGARHIVYVSCDPNTLARDLGILVAEGYRVEWVVPVDLMPQTYHVEVVALLVRDG